MRLMRIYSKIMISRNFLKYILVNLSIMVTYLIIALTTVCLDKILVLSSDSVYSEMRYLYISILTIFLITGICLIVYQYLNIMKSGMRDYCILRGLGATKRNIHLLIFVQVILLIIISLPIGLICGYFLSQSMISLIGGFTGNQYIFALITSTSTLFLAAGVIGSLIISIGIYLDIGVSKMPLENILSDNFLIGWEA